MKIADYIHEIAPGRSVMPQAQYNNLLEAALRMEIAVRCERAYIHDLKNSLQVVHVGVEVLSKAAAANSNQPIDRMVEFAKGAVNQHSKTVESLVSSALSNDQQSTRLDINALIQKSAAFLRNDALQRRVTLELQLCGAVDVEIRLAKVRLVLMALITDAIDAMPDGGGIVIKSQTDNHHISIEVQDSRLTKATKPESIGGLEVNLTDVSLREALIVPVVDNLIAAERGSVEHQVVVPTGHCVRIILPVIA